MYIGQAPHVQGTTLFPYRPRHVMTTVEAIVKEASRVPLYLPNVSALKEALRKAREWSDKVDQVQV